MRKNIFKKKAKKRPNGLGLFKIMADLRGLPLNLAKLPLLLIEIDFATTMGYMALHSKYGFSDHHEDMGYFNCHVAAILIERMFPKFKHGNIFKNIELIHGSRLQLIDSTDSNEEIDCLLYSHSWIIATDIYGIQYIIDPYPIHSKHCVIEDAEAVKKIYVPEKNSSINNAEAKVDAIMEIFEWAKEENNLQFSPRRINKVYNRYNLHFNSYC